MMADDISLLLSRLDEIRDEVKENRNEHAKTREEVAVAVTRLSLLPCAEHERRIKGAERWNRALALVGGALATIAGFLGWRVKTG